MRLGYQVPKGQGKKSYDLSPRSVGKCMGSPGWRRFLSRYWGPALLSVWVLRLQLGACPEAAVGGVPWEPEVKVLGTDTSHHFTSFWRTLKHALEKHYKIANMENVLKQFSNMARKSEFGVQVINALCSCKSHTRIWKDPFKHPLQTRFTFWSTSGGVGTTLSNPTVLNPVEGFTPYSEEYVSTLLIQ